MGSGYKNFTAGSVLTASDVNNYLMEQSVMFFSTTAARDSAITSPEDGMVVYIGSNDANEGLYTYNGTSWRKGASWNDPWGVVVATSGGTSGRGYATTSSASSTTTSTTDWSGLTVTWTAINNRIYRTTVAGMLQTDNASGSDYARLIIANSSNTVLAAAQGIVQATAGVDVYDGRTVVYVEAGVSGSQTRKARVSRASGAGNVSGFASATIQASIVVEDLGPSGAPV